MADKVTKTGTVEQKFVLNFDTAPTIAQLLAACKAIDAADRAATLKVARGPNDSQVQGPTRFTFTAAASTDTDIPIV